MFCVHCGKQNSDEYRFCPKCGAVIELLSKTSATSQDVDSNKDYDSLLGGEYEEEANLLERDSVDDLRDEREDEWRNSKESPAAEQSNKHDDIPIALIIVPVIIVIAVIFLSIMITGEKETNVSSSNKQAVEKFEQSEKKSAGASQASNNENLNNDKPSQESKLPEATLIEDISIAELLKTGAKQKCGNHVLQLKENIDEYGVKNEYIEIMNDRGAFYDSIEGWRISEVACKDLTGDGKINLFLQYLRGGMSPNDYSNYAYILDDPIRLILNHTFHYVSHFIDLNNDGIQEIQSHYSFRYIGGLCGNCSPPWIEQYLCYHNGRYKDCSNQFPDNYAEVISFAKEIISDELEKIPNIESISDDSELDKLKAYSVLVLVSAILLDKEDQESEYLRKTLPGSVFNWLNETENRDYINNQLGLK
jgi:hypothetical protein